MLKHREKHKKLTNVKSLTKIVFYVYVHVLYELFFSSKMLRICLFM